MKSTSFQSSSPSQRFDGPPTKFSGIDTAARIKYFVDKAAALVPVKEKNDGEDENGMGSGASGAIASNVSDRNSYNALHYHQCHLYIWKMAYHCMIH